MKLLVLILCVSSIWAFPKISKGTALKKKIDGRIIGGSQARAAQFPFAAAMYTHTADGNYFCGGALLTSEWIVTAGQCVDGVELFDIHLGTTTLNGNDDYRVNVASDTYVLHPDYDPRTLDNDIGLVLLRLPVTFSDYLKPVDFLPFAELPNGASAVALGWGQIDDEDAGLVDELHWVYLTTLSNVECTITYGTQITDNMVCVDGNYNEGTCNGDSGSPLVQTISRGHSVIVGVSSFYSGNGCESTDPSGFARIYGSNEWITNVTGRS